MTGRTGSRWLVLVFAAILGCGQPPVPQAPEDGTLPAPSASADAGTSTDAPATAVAAPLASVAPAPVQTPVQAPVQPDCAQSEQCKKSGRCRAIDQECVTSCRQHSSCAKLGTCTEQDGACVATSTPDCAASELCKKQGACAARDGLCEPGKTADCERFPGCEGQRCFFFLGQCREKGPCGCDLGGGGHPVGEERDDHGAAAFRLAVLTAACVRAGGTPPDCKRP